MEVRRLGMISGAELIERIQKKVGVPCQIHRSDGFSDGILFGRADTMTTGIAPTFIPILDEFAANEPSRVGCRLSTQVFPREE